MGALCTCSNIDVRLVEASKNVDKGTIWTGEAAVFGEEILMEFKVLEKTNLYNKGEIKVILNAKFSIEDYEETKMVESRLSLGLDEKEVSTIVIKVLNHPHFEIDGVLIDNQIQGTIKSRASPFDIGILNATRFNITVNNQPIGLLSDNMEKMEEVLKMLPHQGEFSLSKFE